MKTLVRSFAVSALLCTSIVFVGQPASAFTCPPTWFVLSTSSPSATYNVLSKVDLLNSSDGWAVGSSSSSVTTSVILRWNGSNWALTPAATFPSGDDYLNGVIDLSPTDAWAVGSQTPTGGTSTALVEHWDGGSWTTSISKTLVGWDADLNGVAASRSNDLWAVGGKARPASPYKSKPLAMHWNGSSWSVVGTPKVKHSAHTRLDDVAAISPRNVWAVGNRYAGGHYRTLIEHWNGREWSVVASPNVGNGDNTLRSVFAVSPTNIWAVGHSTAVGLSWRNLIEHWNGTKWSVVASPSPTPKLDTLNSIRGVAANDIWAVGIGFDSLLTTEQTVTLHYDGSSWTQVPSVGAGTSDALYGVSAVPGMEMAVGFSTTGSVITTLAEVRC